MEDSEHIKWKVDWGQRIKVDQGIMEEVLSKSDGGGGCGRWRMMNVCMSDSQTLILGKFLRAGILFHRLC